MAFNNAYMRGMKVSCAAPDDDPLAQGLGMHQDEEDGAVYYGEIGEGQMHGLGRMDAAGATYLGFWERGSYHGPGLLLNHEERTRQEGTFKDGLLAEGSSTSAAVDRQGPRGADGVGLEGPGVKVARDSQHGRLRVLRCTFKEDQPEGRGSMWILSAGTGGDGAVAGADGRSGKVLEQRFEGLFHRDPTYGRTYFQDGRAYIGGFEGYRGRKGLGFTVTKLGKGLIANREGPKQIGVGLIIDFTAQSYKRTSAAGEEEAEVSMAGAAATSTGAAAVPDFWDEAGVYALLRSVVEDPSGHWAAMVKFTEALRAEQAKLLHEEAPAVPIQAYAREPMVCPESIYVGGRDAQGRRHGEGAGVLGNGDIYKGQWRQGRPQGKGALVSVAHRDVFEGEVGPPPKIVKTAAAAAADGEAGARASPVFDSSTDPDALSWGAGKWSLLTGWRVEAARWLRPRVPQDFVTVLSAPDSEQKGQRSKVEAFYRVGKDGVSRRDDADVRVTMGPGEALEDKTIFRGQVYATPEAEGLFNVPKKRMGLLYEGERRGSMMDAAWQEDGAQEDVVFGLVRKEDGETEYDGKCSKTHPKMCDRWFYSVYVPTAADNAERTWPPRLMGPFEQCVPGAKAGDPEKMATKAAANCGEKGGAAVAGGGGKGKGGGAVPKKQQEPKQQPQQRQQRERAESWQQSPQQEAKPVPRWREAEPPAGNAWEQGPPRPRTSPSLGGSETSSQAARDVPPLEMQATNPMEVVLLQQQQAKQEAEAAGLDFDSMLPSARFPVAVEAHVEGGWCAVYIKVDYWLPDSNIKPTKFRVTVMRPDNQGTLKLLKKVAFSRREFPIFELQNNVRYEFIPSITLQYKDFLWQVEGAAIKTSPPGAVKVKPKDLRQPFTRPLNERGEMVPANDHGFWGYTRYVSGYELFPELPPMRTYAIKTRVDNGPGTIGVEISLARALHEAVKKVKVYVRPEDFPSPEDDDAGALDAVAINDDGAPYVRAEAHGLSADSIYACTFRLLFPDGSCYPRSDEDMPPLLGMPTPAPSSFEDQAAAQRLLEQQLKDQLRQQQAAARQNAEAEAARQQEQQKALAAALAKAMGGGKEAAAPALAPVVATKPPAPAAPAAPAPVPVAAAAAAAAKDGTITEMERLLADMLKTGVPAPAPAPAPAPVPAPVPAPAIPQGQLESILASMLPALNLPAVPPAPAQQQQPEQDKKLPAPTTAAKPAAPPAPTPATPINLPPGLATAAATTAAAAAPKKKKKQPAATTAAAAPIAPSVVSTPPAPPGLMNGTEEQLHGRLSSILSSFAPLQPQQPQAQPQPPPPQQSALFSPPGLGTSAAASPDLSGSSSFNAPPASLAVPPLSAPILTAFSSKSPMEPQPAFDRAIGSRSPGVPSPARSIQNQFGGGTAAGGNGNGGGVGGSGFTIAGSSSLLSSDDGGGSSHNSALSTPKGSHTGSLEPGSLLPDLAGLSLGDVASSAEAQELVMQLQQVAREKREAVEARRREERTLRDLKARIRVQEMEVNRWATRIEFLEEQERNLSEDLALL